MKVLYIGNQTGTSLQRINAFKRLEIEITIFDPWEHSVIPSRLLNKYIFDFGGIGLIRMINYLMKRKLSHVKADFVWINGGDLIGPHFVRWLKESYGFVLNYNNDLPFGNRDKNRWIQYFKSVAFYDLLLVRSNTNIELPIKMGAKKVASMYMLSDEIIHRKQPMTELQRSQYESQVLFVGTWFPERGGFVEDLIKKGVPLTIYGDRWNKSPEWSRIKNHWKGPSLNGLEYSYAIQSAQICLGLVSEENNDLHTSRSIEVPAIGSLLCAKRTYEHLLMYEEGKEAFFWNDAGECADICKNLLNDESLINSVAKAGSVRAIKNELTNESFIQGVLGYIKKQKVLN
jgi:spore maturation protein CgeB